jgi:hypothetical protein
VIVVLALVADGRHRYGLAVVNLEKQNVPGRAERHDSVLSREQLRSMLDGS